MSDLSQSTPRSPALDRRLLDSVSALSSNQSLIELIETVTSESQSTIARRLLAEHSAVGTHVRREFRARGFTPWVDQPELVDFYQTSDAFLYEAIVWNRFPAKRQMRRWIGRFAKRTLPRGARVLAFGDGPGFDACFLAGLGYRVTLVEPSTVQRAFAEQLAEECGADVDILAELPIDSAGAFDAVVCLDVLEHLPSPGETVASLTELLAPTGVLIVHAPFYLIDKARPTHLRENVRHSGRVDLFTRCGLRVVGGQLFWNPLVLARPEVARRWQRVLRPTIGRAILSTGRWTRLLGYAADRLARRPNEFIPELEALAATGEVDRPCLQPAVAST